MPSLSQRKQLQLGTWILIPFFGVFFLVGFLIFLFATLPAYRESGDAANWKRVEATILSASVRSDRDSDGDMTYRPVVTYSYRVNGREYKSSRIALTEMSSSRVATAQAIVDELPEGSTRTAFVNPQDPTQAVLNREDRGGLLVLTLVPGIFMLVGAIGVLGAAIAVARAASRSALGDPANTSMGSPFSRTARVPLRHGERFNEPTGPVVLCARKSRIGGFVGLLLVSLFWNGIVSIFVYSVFASGDGWLNLFTCFLIPFVAIGVGLIGATFKFFLRIFNPRLTLTLPRDGVRLGTPTAVQYQFDGRFDRMHRMHVKLEGREEARYRRGTKTHTDKSVFYRQVLLDTSRVAEIHRGKFTISLPADSMHTFSASSNKIIWTLSVTGEIANWPDVVDSFDIDVQPIDPRALPPRAVEEGAS